MRLLERLGIVVVSFAIAIAVIVVLSGGPLSGRDNPRIHGPTAQLGLQDLVSPLRLRGMAAMLARIKRQVRDKRA